MPEDDRNYDLQARTLPRIAAPALPYQPPELRRAPLNIGLIGCGGITETHLAVYREVGYRVVAISSRSRERAESRRREFFPEAAVYSDYRALLGRRDVQIVDIATDAAPRPAIIEAALNAGKHVLSQKPFVLDLDTGRRLADLADRRNLKLAVNQNGRWAPHFSYMREAVAAGLVGSVASLAHTVHWDHNWIRGTPFDGIRHVVLYDFGIHWFDFVASVMHPAVPRRVTARLRRSPSQQADPPLLADVSIAYDAALVTLTFDADTRVGAEDRTVLRGSQALLRSVGPSLSEQSLTGFTTDGRFQPDLEGTWFRQGFHGTMAELMCAVEEDRQPRHAGRHNLESLRLCFAAVHSAETDSPVDPAAVTALPPAAG